MIKTGLSITSSNKIISNVRRTLNYSCQAYKDYDRKKRYIQEKLFEEMEKRD